MVPIALALAVNAVAGGLAIPVWGIQGAAWSAVVGALTWVISAMIISERLHHIDYPHSVLAVQTAIGLATTAMLVWSSSASAAPSLGLMRLVLVVVAVLLLAATMRGAASTAASSAHRA